MQCACRLQLNRFQHIYHELFRENFRRVGASHFLVTYSVHLDCIPSAYIFTVIYQHNKASCGKSEIILTWLVIILDHFLERYTVVRSPIHELRQLAQSTLRNQSVELQYSFITGCCKSFFENILLSDNFMVNVYHLS